MTSDRASLAGAPASRPAMKAPAPTCPRQADGPAAEREARLDALFASRYAEDGTPELTAAVWSVLTEDPAE